MKRTAFTLIELLVVIAIIAILAAILFPVFAQAKEAAKITKGLSACKQLGTAIAVYENSFDDMIPLGGINSRSLNERSVGTSEWQEAIFPYVKSEAIYRLESDPTKYVRMNDDSECPIKVSRRTTTLSASSFVSSFNITTPISRSDGTLDRAAVSATALTAPAQFIMLMNAQRPVVGGTGSGLRYAAEPRDHNGDACSLWLAIYSQVSDGGAGHMFNGDQVNGYTVPHHKRGGLFSFADTHAKFVPIDPARQPEKQLEGKMPWCKWGRVNAEDETCFQIWNNSDTLE